MIYQLILGIVDRGVLPRQWRITFRVLNLLWSRAPNIQVVANTAIHLERWIQRLERIAMAARRKGSRGRTATKHNLPRMMAYKLLPTAALSTTIKPYIYPGYIL